MKDLWSKEHYSHKINTIVVKSNAYPHPFIDNLPIWITPLQNLKTHLRPSFYNFKIFGQVCFSTNQITGFFDHQFLWEKSIDILVFLMHRVSHQGKIASEITTFDWILTSVSLVQTDRKILWSTISMARTNQYNIWFFAWR